MLYVLFLYMLTYEAFIKGDVTSHETQLRMSGREKGVLPGFAKGRDKPLRMSKKDHLQLWTVCIWLAMFPCHCRFSLLDAFVPDPQLPLTSFAGGAGMPWPPAVLQGEQRRQCWKMQIGLWGCAVGGCVWWVFHFSAGNVSLLSNVSERGPGRLVVYLRMLQPQREVRSSVPVRLLSPVQNCYLSYSCLCWWKQPWKQQCRYEQFTSVASRLES